MWDQRYSSDEYAYGTQANDFLKQYAHHIPKGKVLSLAEGEGRNAVFLAQQGYEVTAVDSSSVGIEKAKRLAERQGVEINFVHADVLEYEVGQEQWDGIISIFFPLAAPARKQLYKKVTSGLGNGGVFLLEAYTPKQLNYGTGGGDDIELMQSKSSLLEELPDLTIEHLVELERSVVEGQYHTGMASVVQVIAKKISA